MVIAWLNSLFAERVAREAFSVIDTRADRIQMTDSARQEDLAMVLMFSRTGETS